MTKQKEGDEGTVIGLFGEVKAKFNEEIEDLRAQVKSLTDEEYKDILKNAELSGMSITDFIVQRCVSDFEPKTDQLSRLNVMSWASFAGRVVADGRAEGRLAATVTRREDSKSGSGNRFAFVGFSDVGFSAGGQFEAVVFADVLASADDKLETGKNVLINVEGKVEFKEGVVLVRVLTVAALDDDILKRRDGKWMRKYRAYPGAEWE